MNEISLEAILVLIILVEVSFLLILQYVPNRHKKNLQRIFIDSSVLIDGRILDIVKTGFMDGYLEIPRSVIGELQYMADNADGDKRLKARQGLDLIPELQALKDIHVNIFDDSSIASHDVDDNLILLAKKYGGSICTLDYNLNKVAKVDDIKVLNINDLVLSLRSNHLPGEQVEILLNQKGQSQGQALGRLDDGTMVVVEKASNRVGQKVKVEFVRDLQTAAGKMMFAKIVKSKDSRITKSNSKDKTHKTNNRISQKRSLKSK